MKELFNLKSFFTFLSRNIAYAAINVFGLSISLMFVILIGIYTWQEGSIDHQHDKAEQIYTLGIEFPEDGSKALGLHHAVLKQFKKHYPEIENTCGFIVSLLRLQKEGEYKNVVTMLSDSSLFSMFDFPLIEGDRKTCLKERNSAVITEQFANKWFGNADALGKEIVWNDSIRFRVTGIVKDFDNTIVNSKVDIIINFYWNKYLNAADTDELFPNVINSTGCSSFLQVRKGTEMLGREDEFTNFIETFWEHFKGDNNRHKVILTPLNKLHFTQLERYNDNLNIGNSKMVNILFVVGLVILLFAVMNYINLTVAQSGYRSREIATRRLFGANQKNIIMRLMMESTMLCALSFTISIAFALLFAPITGRLLNTPMHMSILKEPVFIIIAIIAIVLIGALSGAFPALVMSRAKPIEVVKGTFRQRTKMVLSKIFIILQNVITIIMLASALVMTFQTRHLTSAPLGFKTHKLICLTQYHAFNSKEYPVFIEKIKRLPSVSLVAASMGTPQDGGNNNTIVEQGKSYSFQLLVGDMNFMNIYGLALTNHHHIAHYPVVFANTPALGALNMSPTETHMSELFKKFGFMGIDPEASFGGVLSELHLNNILTEANKPLLVSIEEKLDHPWNLTIQVEGNPLDAYKEIQKIFKEVYHEELDESHPLVEDYIQTEFEKEQQITNIVSIFAFIAILISLLGLIAMSTYFIQQRSQEIALRKIFGSTSNQIRKKLIRTFLAYVGIAFIISAPLTWSLVSEWISDYSYRIVWWPWIIVSGITVMLIALASVSIQSYIASNENPIKHIKQE